MTPSRDAAAYFGDRADHYDSRYERLDADGHALRARMAAVVRLVADGPGDALDAGMGPGRLCSELDRRGWTVSGVDASEAMVEVARARLPAAAARLHCAEIEALPFPDASFDVVTATGVLEYSDVPRALRELVRVLRPGGRAVVSYPNPSALYGIWKTRLWYPAVRARKRLARHEDRDMPRGAGRLSPTRFAALLEEAGLEPTTIVHTSYLAVVTPLDRLLPGATARLGQRLERRAPLPRLLATQIVYEARSATR